MGMYDTICYKCLKCGTNNFSQTKLSSCLMDSINVGEIFLGEETTMNLIMKDGCENCKSQNCIQIVKGKIISVVPMNKATHKEGYWGNLESVSHTINNVNNGGKE